MLDEDTMVCPHCGETLEFDFDDDDEDISFEELDSGDDEDGNSEE